LQANREKESTKEIIIDLGLAQEQEEKVKCNTREEGPRIHRQKILRHQSSYPIIVVNLHSGNSSKHRASVLEHATSQGALQPDGSEQNRTKTRSLEDTSIKTIGNESPDKY